MVAKDNVLITITTAAGMAGINQAKEGMFGLNLTTVALTAVIGLAVAAGKSMVDIAEQQEKAHKNLAQAVAVSGANLAQTTAFVDTFRESNRSYVSSLSEVEDSYGALLRSGVPTAEAQKDLNRATDLAALKGISLIEATNLLVAAEHGRTRGLIDLGVTTAKFTDAEGNVIKGGHNMAAVMAEIDAKTKGGRDTLSETQIISNRLSNDWQDLSAHGGPAILTLLDAVIKKADDIYMAFDRWGKDDKLWATISARLTDTAKWIKDNILDPLGRLQSWLQGGRSAVGGYDLSGNYIPPPTDRFGPSAGGLASGGPALPGRTYTVGESAIESLTMFPGGGGYVTPLSGGAGRSSGVVHVHMAGIYAGDGPSLDILANKIANRLGYTSGR